MLIFLFCPPDAEVIFTPIHWAARIFIFLQNEAE